MSRKNKLFLEQSACSMAYLFLKACQYQKSGYFDSVKNPGMQQLPEIVLDEIQLFLGNLAEADTASAEYKELIVNISNEMAEGGYGDFDFFSDAISMGLALILGEVNEDLYNLFTYVYGTVLEETVAV